MTKDEKEIAEGIMKFTMEIAELRAYNAERLREAIAWHRSHPAPTVGWTPASKWKDSPMTDTPERALLRRIIQANDNLPRRQGPERRAMINEIADAYRDARTLLAAPPASEGEEYEVQNGYVDGVGHAWVCVCDLVRGLPPGQHVRVTRVAL